MNVLSFLSIISSIINCFTIVVVSKNLHEVGKLVQGRTDLCVCVCVCVFLLGIIGRLLTCFHINTLTHEVRVETLLTH